MRLPPWSSIEEDLRIGFVLVADACRYMTGVGERGDAAAAAILGVTDVPEGQLDDLVEGSEFLGSIAISDTHFAASTRRCYDLVTIRGPLELIDLDEERAEGVHWLSYYLSFMPREAMGGLDYTGTFSHPDAPLVVLLRAAEARLELAEFVQNLVRLGEIGPGLSPKTIANLGEVNLRSVRNVMGPKGDKAIRSNAKASESAERADLVMGDPLDALEWLAGRRAFNPGRLSPGWVNEHLDNLATPEAAAALPGVISWLNRTTTEQMADSLGWSVEQVRDWTRARGLDPGRAAEIGAVAGFDGPAYAACIHRLLSMKETAQGV